MICGGRIIAEILAIVATGIFAGAALHVSIVEQPAGYSPCRGVSSVKCRIAAPLGHQFRAPGLNQIPSLDDDSFQNICKFADAGFPVNEFGR